MVDAIAEVTWSSFSKNGYCLTTGNLCRVLLLFSILTLMLFSVYFYPAPRFYLMLHALALIALAIAAAVALCSTNRVLNFTTILLIVIIFTHTIHLGRWLPPSPNMVSRSGISAQVIYWSQLSDQQRKDRPMGFHLLKGQALGLFSTLVLRSIDDWGLLPRNEHTNRLLGKKMLKPGQLE